MNDQATTLRSLLLHAPDFVLVATIELDHTLRSQLKEAMKHYAEEKAKHFAGWICDQRIEGRTYHKLWLDYLQEHPME